MNLGKPSQLKTWSFWQYLNMNVILYDNEVASKIKFIKCKHLLFSENYIFGKFDTFCKRLERIMDMLNIMESLSCLGEIKIEGIDSLFVRFQGIVTTYKKKNYDILDHRKGEVSLIV